MTPRPALAAALFVIGAGLARDARAERLPPAGAPNAATWR